MRVVMCVLMCIHPRMARAGALKVANKQMLPSSTHIPLTAFPLSSFAISSYLAPPFSLDRLIFHPTIPSPLFRFGSPSTGWALRLRTLNIAPVACRGRSRSSSLPPFETKYRSRSQATVRRQTNFVSVLAVTIKRLRLPLWRL
ncbi:hypothetical protein EDB84DRAFT_1503076 [Lactarius hengduanensis]|nr:hypothetical protein EDB84DRAFT_1503076 [Lactarius hengduanensis]